MAIEGGRTAVDGFPPPGIPESDVSSLAHMG